MLSNYTKSRQISLLIITIIFVICNTMRSMVLLHIIGRLMAFIRLSVQRYCTLIKLIMTNSLPLLLFLQPCKTSYLLYNIYLPPITYIVNNSLQNSVFLSSIKRYRNTSFEQYPDEMKSY